MLHLEKEIGVKDKTLAEFVLSLARKSTNVADFEKMLDSNEADFPIDLINSLYAMITRVIPDIRNQNKAQESDESAEVTKVHPKYHSTGVFQNLDMPAEEEKEIVN